MDKSPSGWGVLVDYNLRDMLPYIISTTITGNFYLVKLSSACTGAIGDGMPQPAASPVEQQP